jgi:chemotaxis protein histidine kinase CheA
MVHRHLTQQRSLAQPAPHALKSSLDTASDPGMAALLDELLADLPSVVAEINAVVEQRQFDELKRIVHQVKGLGGMYGFEPLTELSGKIEALMTEAAPESDVMKQVESLVAMIHSIEGYGRVSKPQGAIQSV